jgi:hypothetical protein
MAENSGQHDAYNHRSDNQWGVNSTVQSSDAFLRLIIR